jgi:hypothetical protein
LLAALSGCERGPGSGSTAPSAAPSSSTRPPAAAASPARTEPDPPAADLDARSLCERFGRTPVPEADLPTDAEREALRGCNAEALYYGIDTPVDFVRARHCAFVELGVDGAPAVGGPEILMMLYANGRGVTANLDLALRFACGAFGSPAEHEARLARLWRTRSQANRAFDPPFDVCDEVTSGELSGYCAGLEERISSTARKARTQRATLGMPGPARARLEAAAERFFGDRARLEVDQTGTGRARSTIEERAGLENDFVARLEQLNDASFSPPRADPKPLEKQLAQLLSRIDSCRDLAELERLVPGAVTRAGIRKTQSSYVAYRGAFVSLALAVHPGSERGAWQAWLDQRRLAQLQELGGGC